MKNLILVLSAWFAFNMTFANTDWINIKERGADIKGEKICTKIIQKAIDEASEDGGGVVYFPAGTYLTGAIHLKSNITLHLDAGSYIKFSDDPEDYLPFEELRWEGTVMKSFSPLIHADQVENITIEGRGTLDGQGKKWWLAMYDRNKQIKETGDLTNIGKYEKMWMEQNKDLKVSDYYQRTMKLRFFRPPFFQAYKSSNIRIVGVKFINSPFWTINPAFCDNITIDGITLINPESPNTDGINPTSCSNMHISNCHLSVGDDCITIKSGRDAQARDINIPCQNITITNCTMLSGHGGVVIGSEVSGSVRKVTISNCIFDGTDRGIRMKSSRERGGIVEEIRVSNVVMKNIQREAFMFNLFYDKSIPEGPVTEKTPLFRNIHISNVTGTEVKQAGRIIGIPEMPIQNFSFSNINIDAEKGFELTTAFGIEFHNITINTTKGPSFMASNADRLVFDNVKTNKPHAETPVVTFENIQNSYLYNCMQFNESDVFLKVTGEKSKDLYIRNNQLQKVKTPYDFTDCNTETFNVE